MTKLEEVFQDRKALIAFITAGDPDIETTEKFIRTMSDSGADIIEIGIPFSDPIAEGVVIQEADLRALQNGVTTEKVFEMIASLRNDIQTPFVIMTYCNVIFGCGTQSFISRCSEIGVNGLIVPDLPYEEKDEFEPFCKASGVQLCSMAAPTSKERTAAIAADAEGFLYLITSGLTGEGNAKKTGIHEMVAYARSDSSVPCAVSCDYQENVSFRELSALADGIILENAVVHLAAEYGKDSVSAIADYVSKAADEIHRK